MQGNQRHPVQRSIITVDVGDQRHAFQKSGQALPRREVFILLRHRAQFQDIIPPFRAVGVVQSKLFVIAAFHHEIEKLHQIGILALFHESGHHFAEARQRIASPPFKRHFRHLCRAGVLVLFQIDQQP